MFSTEKNYTLLLEEELEDRPFRHAAPRRSRTIVPLVLALAISLLANVYYMCKHYAPSMQALNAFEPLSKFAELPRDISIPYTHESIWSLESAASDEAWEAVSIDNGIVALSDDFVSEHGLLPAQRFPWDADKGIYVLNGFHNLHCLKLIRESLVKFQSGAEQSRPLGHILHCVDALRQDVICDADDTPRYTTITNDTKTGTNQPRQCRDWNKLEAWGRANSACFSYVRETDNDYPNLNRFGFCPDESIYKETVERYFKHYPSLYAESGLKRDAIVAEPGSTLKRGDGEVEQPGSTLKRDGKLIEPGSTLKRDEEIEQPGSTLKLDGKVVEPGSTLKREGKLVEPGSTLKREEEIEQPGSTLKRVVAPGSTLKRDGKVVEPGSTLKREEEEIEQPGSTLRREEEEVEQPGSTLRREEKEVQQPGSTLRRDSGEVAEPEPMLKREERVVEPGSTLKRAEEIQQPGSTLKRDGSAIEVPKTVGSTL